MLLILQHQKIFLQFRQQHRTASEQNKKIKCLL